jgi:hypothetical protein
VSPIPSASASTMRAAVSTIPAGSGGSAAHPVAGAVVVVDVGVAGGVVGGVVVGAVVVAAVVEVDVLVDVDVDVLEVDDVDVVELGPGADVADVSSSPEQPARTGRRTAAKIRTTTRRVGCRSTPPPRRIPL